MKTKQELVAERARLVAALESNRTQMMGLTSVDNGWLSGMLDEALIQGQIKALDWASTPDPGGWPHDARAPFMEARANAVRSMRVAGISWAEIMAELNMTEAQVRLIAVFDNTNPARN